MKEIDKMLSGDLYLASDPELRNMSKKAKELLDRFNETKFNDFKGRLDIIKKLFKKVGDNAVINKPFYCDYGSNIEVGNNFYANFDCIILDVNQVIIGDNVMFGPKVAIYTAGHPIDKDVRNTNLEFGKRIEIGNNVWIGGNVVINPGIKIGSNVVIGSGAVVTRDIPNDVVAAGNPCRVIRKIDENDKFYWENKMNNYYKF